MKMGITFANPWTSQKLPVLRQESKDRRIEWIVTSRQANKQTRNVPSSWCMSKFQSIRFLLIHHGFGSPSSLSGNSRRFGAFVIYSRWRRGCRARPTVRRASGLRARCSLCWHGSWWRWLLSRALRNETGGQRTVRWYGIVTTSQTTENEAMRSDVSCGGDDDDDDDYVLMRLLVVVVVKGGGGGGGGSKRRRQRRGQYRGILLISVLIWPL